MHTLWRKMGSLVHYLNAPTVSSVSVFSSSHKLAVHQKLGLEWLVWPLNMHCVAYFSPLRLLTSLSAIIMKVTPTHVCQKVSIILKSAVKPQEREAPLSQCPFLTSIARSHKGHHISPCCLWLHSWVWLPKKTWVKWKSIGWRRERTGERCLWEAIKCSSVQLMSCEIQQLGNTEVILRFPLCPLPMSASRTLLQASALRLLHSLMLEGCSFFLFFFFYIRVHLHWRNLKFQREFKRNQPQ